MEIPIILLLILLNGLLSMSEIAVISARKTNLKKEADRGSKSAKIAYGLQTNPGTFLSTIQVGITLIGILTGLYSGDVLAARLAPFLDSWGIPYAHNISQVSIVIIVTYVTIIFGELVPKRIGLSAAEKVAKAMAQPMYILSRIARPFVWLLSRTTDFFTNLFGIRENRSKITEEEIKAMVREGTLGGEVQVVEQDIVERIFSLGDRDLESIMTPRRDIVWLDLRMNKKKIKEVLAESNASKFPVIDEDRDRVKGVVYLKDIFARFDSPTFSLEDIIQPAQYFYESMEVYSALEAMRQSQNHFALIVDEFGTLSGVVSLKDIMEAMVGEIPEKNEIPDIVLQEDETYLVNGKCSFYDFLHYFKKSDLGPGNEYNTVGGLLLEKFGHLPQPGEELLWEGFRFKLLKVDGVIIDQVLVQIEPNGE